MQALASHGGAAPVIPSSARVPQAYSPASAPSTTPAPICSAQGRRASGRFRLQPTTSHSSVAGSAPPVISATRLTQSDTPLATYISPTATTTSTYSTARRITPTWQASNTSTGAALARARGNVRSVKVDRI